MGRGSILPVPPATAILTMVVLWFNSKQYQEKDMYLERFLKRISQVFGHIIFIYRCLFVIQLWGERWRNQVTSGNERWRKQIMPGNIVQRWQDRLEDIYNYL